jgi:FkbH-like protein
MGNTRKCLVLDLDNTLWGGVVGDDGWEGIQLDPNNAVGEAYRAFQSYCLALRKRGVILAICSKNDEMTAKEPFEKNENMILSLNDVSCFVANWENKADNLRKIANELNIGIDSLVFFDDNPAEREIVKQFVPEVHVVDVPADPAFYVLQMEKEQPFEWLQITKEDLERTDSYSGNAKRQQLQESFVDYNEYLKALDMRGEVSRVRQSDVARFTQLINKSNQFNLRTIRYSESDVQQMISDDTVCCLYGKLSDCYSNYGIISCVILRKEDDVCFIDTWVMSCRVLKRGVENMMFEAVLKAAKKMQCSSIRAEYIKTKKNKLVESFYETLGFELLETKLAESNVSKEYKLNELNRKTIHFIKEVNLDD